MILFSSLLIGLLWLPAARSQGASEQPPVRQLMERLEQTTTLKTDVEQLTLDQNGREIQEVSARLIMSKPDRFNWTSLAPYEEVITTNGDLIWVYEPDLEQVTIQKFQDEANRTPAMLLSEDEETLTASFDISVSVLPHNNRTRFVLKPRISGSLFEDMSLTFFGSILEEMQFEDSLGQKTSLTFSRQETNVPLDESLFTFQVPDGVEVIDSSGN